VSLRRAVGIRLVQAAVVLAAGLLAACSQGSGALSDLEGVDELRAEFNREAGKPRIVLLLSPT
jgi:hypothetical protein